MTTSTLTEQTKNAQSPERRLFFFFSFLRILKMSVGFDIDLLTKQCGCDWFTFDRIT